jgi:hypothetical protein
MSEAQALIFKDESREYFVEVRIDNQSNIVIILNNVFLC